MKRIALTDHHGFSGIKEMFSAIGTIRNVTGVEIGFVPGIEFSTNCYYDTDNKKEVHILEYFPSSNFRRFKN